MLGPNCMGIAIPGGASCWLGTLPQTFSPGRVAVVTQSGSTGEALTALGPRIGFRCVISSGAEMVRDASDFCALLAADEETRVVGLFLETVRRPAAFAHALELLAEAGAAVGLPVVTEVLEPSLVDVVSSYADVLQIGSRNMANTPLLRAVGRARRPVMLKRGMAATVDEWLLAAEYVLAEGNEQVILCERGVRGFEPHLRNLLDPAVVPLLRTLTHLPVIVDPSHAVGRRDLVAPAACAAIAAGADGVMIEVHPDPASALTDGPQAVPCGELPALAAGDPGVRFLAHAAAARSSGGHHCG